MRRILSLFVSAMALTAFAAPSVSADMVLYSNTTNFSGYAYANGSAATDTGGGMSTAMVADDIHLTSGIGAATVDSITFSVANLNAAAVSANVDIRIYSVGTNGGPGTIIAGLNFNPISFASGVGLYTYTSTSTIFTMPTSGSIYIGEFFTSDAISGTTAAQLNELGEGLFNPPTVGSSNDYFFSTGTGGGTNLTSNPSGSFLYFGGSPVANFGFGLSGFVPAPPSILLTGIPGLLGLVACGFRRLRRPTTIA